MKTQAYGQEIEVVMRFSCPDIDLEQDEILERLRNTNLSILITGESGTGKELMARAIHLRRALGKGPFIAIDCGALPSSLIEAELFGYRKGSFTGAVISKIGLLACAEGGTIFLDEIGDLPLDLQPKLLRALQEREIRPIGSLQPVPIWGLVIAATNRDLEKMVREGKFREDLYYRLNVLRLNVAPLREYKENIAATCHVILRAFERGSALHHELSDEALRLLCAYDWPGNTRELENCLKRIVALKPLKSVIEVWDLPPRLRAGVVSSKMICRNHRGTLYQLEKDALLEAVEAAGGDKQKASKQLGIGKTTLYRKLKEYQSEIIMKKTC